jgi:spoIIIJ-associated protein
MRSGDRLTSVEIQAVTVEDAIRLALDQLALTRDDVDIEILSDAGSSEDEEALVRVTAKGMASQPISNGGRSSSPRNSGGDRGRADSGRGDRDNRPARPRRVPGDRPSSRGVPPPRVERVIDPNRVDAEDESQVKEVVKELLGRMGVTSEVMAIDNPSSLPMTEEDAPTIFIDIVGSDLGNLIGRRGEHLSQFQYLVNLLCSKSLTDGKRVVIDVEGYRTRREESLIGLADRVSRQVARSRRAMMMEPMPANERRIIHLKLREHPDVYTESSGEGSNRRVEVLPRD